MHVWGWMCTSVQHIPFLHSSPLLHAADSPQSDGADEAILSQKVYGELVILVSLVRNVRVKSLCFSTDRSDYRELFRIHVSRPGAGKPRAVLEGVGLDNSAIEECFRNNPRDVVEAVQTGLIKWSGGHHHKPPTWKVLLEAMEYAEIAQQHVQDLMARLRMRALAEQSTTSAPERSANSPRNTGMLPLLATI